MIKFKWIEWKNFLSYGNYDTRVSLEDGPVLISGNNGSGKSTLLDALCYVMYGKGFRNIPKGKLINSINNKGLEVTVNFEIGNRSYEVYRSEKPGALTVLEGGVPWPEETTKTDMQTKLELLMGMDLKVFKQIVVLGSASYEPFMALPALKRREFIERLLGLQYLGQMYSAAHEQFKAATADGQKAQQEVTSLLTEMLVLQRTMQEYTEQDRDTGAEMAALKATAQAALTSSQERQGVLLGQMGDLKGKIEALDASSDGLRAMIDVQAALTEVGVNIRHSTTQLQKAQQSTCPTCERPFDVEQQALAQKTLGDEIASYGQQQITLKDELRKVTDFTTERMQLMEQGKRLGSEIGILQNAIPSLEAQLTAVAPTQKTDSSEAIAALKKEIADKQARVDELKETILPAAEHAVMIATQTKLCLKEDGLKARIVEEYVPFINQRVNHYLDQMGLFTGFELDSSFNEKITQRHRDSYVYESFSEGEKCRIDLALLLTWRELAMFTNAIQTELLIIDEVFDKSFDSDGYQRMATLLTHLADRGIKPIMLTPRQQIPTSIFIQTYTADKEKDFSYLTVDESSI